MDEPTYMLCTVDDVLALYDGGVDSEKVREMARRQVLYASDDARDLAGQEWTSTSVPAPISRIVAAAVARWLSNPDGLIQSRAGDETLAWADREDGDTVRFTEREQARIRRIGNPRIKGFGSIQISAYGEQRRPHTLYVPSADGTKPFPLIDNRDRWW